MAGRDEPVDQLTGQLTRLFPDAKASEARRFSSSLPPDLLEQIRGRIQFLALFLLAAFLFDPLMYFGVRGVNGFRGVPVPPPILHTMEFQFIHLGFVVVSATLALASRSARVSASRLLTLALAYEIVICFTIALLTYWGLYEEKGILANLTWVPAIVIMFPLVVPGPPIRMLATSIAAAGMSPLSLAVLDATGRVHADLDAYVQAVIHAAFASGFAYMGARIIYGLRREVAAARELGSYRLEEKLGSGGMGEVWRARHRLLARPAAIKIIRPSLTLDASRDAVRRFEREAQVIASLRSPHTVNLFDFGVADNGAFYYVMELLDGLDAHRLVRGFGPLPAARVVHVLRQVCHSLSEAESCGIVHRDIKPANIFLCRYGEDHDFVKVLDFGLVKTGGSAPDAGPALTRTDIVQGTPAFMSPEQALGQADVDGRADIYALGCVAYWLLTGALVFTADTPMALLVEHINTRPTPPSSRVELPIPAALDRLVLSCLAKNPSERPQTARDLSRCLADIDLPHGWNGDQAREWWTLHQPVAAAAS